MQSRSSVVSAVETAPEMTVKLQEMERLLSDLDNKVSAIYAAYFRIQRPEPVEEAPIGKAPSRTSAGIANKETVMQTIDDHLHNLVVTHSRLSDLVGKFNELV